MMPSMPPTPRWFTAIVVICCLPLFLMPWLLNAPYADADGVKIFIWLYPVYVIVAGWLAWQCYPQRRAMAWVLLALMLLSHGAIWLLATSPIQ